MAIDREQLNAALSMLREDEKGIYYSGQLALLPSQLYGNIFQSVQFDRKRVSNEAQLRDLYYYLTHCKNDLNDILTIVFRLEWQKEIKAKGELDSPLWERFVSTDIDLFHVEIRSLFDYVARALIRVSGSSPGQLPNSFRKLRDWIANYPTRVPRFGEDLAQAITSCDWFSEIRGVRDAIVHSGGVTAS